MYRQTTFGTLATRCAFALGLSCIYSSELSPTAIVRLRMFTSHFKIPFSEKQGEYYDEPTQNETPNKTRERLADLASSCGVDKGAFLEQ